MAQIEKQLEYNIQYPMN